jgi:hypothetical protein
MRLASRNKYDGVRTMMKLNGLNPLRWRHSRYLLTKRRVRWSEGTEANFQFLFKVHGTVLICLREFDATVKLAGHCSRRPIAFAPEGSSVGRR